MGRDGKADGLDFAPLQKIHVGTHVGGYLTSGLHEGETKCMVHFACSASQVSRSRLAHEFAVPNIDQCAYVADLSTQRATQRFRACRA